MAVAWLKLAVDVATAKRFYAADGKTFSCNGPDGKTFGDGKTFLYMPGNCHK